MSSPRPKNDVRQGTAWRRAWGGCCGTP